MTTTIYKTLCERLSAAGIGIQYISLWNNNTAQMSAEAAFGMPAVFIEFLPVEWKQLQNGVRSAETHIVLHILQESVATSEHGGQYQDIALERLVFFEKINACVQGLSGEKFNTFMLVTSELDHDHDSITHDAAEFVTHITDTSAQKPQHKAVGLNLSIKK